MSAHSLRSTLSIIKLHCFVTILLTLAVFTTSLVAVVSASSVFDGKENQHLLGLPQADEEHQPTDIYDEPEDELEEDYSEELNVTAEKWKYLGSPCDFTCNPSLQHVVCDQQTKFCQCEKHYPVELGPTKGCAKPKKLGEQCLYRATCLYTDQHSTCTQIQHNAMCECEEGYHRVPLSRSNKKLFCAADLLLIASDLPTLLGVASGIAVFTGAICFVLKLYSRARYTRPRHYANAGHTQPILFTSDAGIPLALHGAGRQASRSFHRNSSIGTSNCNNLRKQSCPAAANTSPSRSRAGAARAAAILLISHQAASSSPINCEGNDAFEVDKHRRALSDVVEASPDGLGSRRPSLASIHSTASSAKSFSYSARRFERERNEKEQRHALVELKLKQQQQQSAVAVTSSPRSPKSMNDELLPNAAARAKEVLSNEPIATTSGMTGNGTTPKVTITTTKLHTTTMNGAKINEEIVSPIFNSDSKARVTAEVYRS